MSSQLGRFCIAASLSVLAVSALAQEAETTGNMKPNATSTQHPVDETPQHSHPPTAGETTLQNEVVKDANAAEPTADAPAEEAVPGQSERIRRAASESEDAHDENGRRSTEAVDAENDALEESDELQREDVEAP